MTGRIPIRLAVEDDLSEFVLRRVLRDRPSHYDVGAVYTRGGFGYLKRQAASFNNAAKAGPFLLLTDLDHRYSCPPELIARWLGSARHPHFLLRVAVREVESWLLADEENLRSFLGLKRVLHLPDPETIPDPKTTLLGLAAKTRNRELRDALVWRDDRSGRLLQGPDYNGAMCPFVARHWDVSQARRRCASLGRMIDALARLEKSC
jgi:Domain of unknown function (DUF4276)